MYAYLYVLIIINNVVLVIIAVYENHEQLFNNNQSLLNSNKESIHTSRAGSMTRALKALANPYRTLLKIASLDVSIRFTSGVPGGNAIQNKEDVLFSIAPTSRKSRFASFNIRTSSAYTSL